jgi:Arc/MetJ family transcription regulator
MLQYMVKRTVMNLDLELVAEARGVLGTAGTTDTVHRALAEVVRQQRLRELAELRFENLEPGWLDELRRCRTESR